MQKKPEYNHQSRRHQKRCQKRKRSKELQIPDPIQQYQGHQQKREKPDEIDVEEVMLNYFLKICCHEHEVNATEAHLSEAEKYVRHNSEKKE